MQYGPVNQIPNPCVITALQADRMPTLSNNSKERTVLPKTPAAGHCTLFSPLYSLYKTLIFQLSPESAEAAQSSGAPCLSLLSGCSKALSSNSVLSPPTLPLSEKRGLYKPNRTAKNNTKLCSGTSMKKTKESSVCRILT
jgi:hypothetical protein